MDRQSRTHGVAVLVFLALVLVNGLIGRRPDAAPIWDYLAAYSFLGAILAAWRLIRRFRAIRDQEEEVCSPESVPGFPEGQARLIDSGRLPNRFNNRIRLQDNEICHFIIPASRLIFQPPPLKVDPSHILIRQSGGQLYFIIRPEELLLLAETESVTSGEFAITNQRVLFMASENGFEVPLRQLRALDCSAYLIDFTVSGHRYTIQSGSACYAEKVFDLLSAGRTNGLQRP